MATRPDFSESASQPADRSTATWGAAPGARPGDDATDGVARRAQWSNWTVLAMIVLCFFVIVRFRPFQAATAPTDGVDGPRLERLELKPLGGTSRGVRLEDLTGRVVLVCFWATWEPESRDGLARVVDVNRAFAGAAGFRFLPVSCGRTFRENLPELDYETRELLRQANLEMPALADPGGVTRSAVADAAGLDGPPAAVLIDRRGRVRRAWRQFDARATTEMREWIGRLLDET